MGITLYRPGNTSKIKGIKCEMKTFDEYSYLHNLENGWFYSPDECYPKPEKTIPSKNTRRDIAKKNKPEVRKWQPEI